MKADVAMAATGCLSIMANVMVTLPGPLLFRRIGNLVNEICQQANVTSLPQQDAIRRLTIASGAARFLVILLHRFRQRQMDDGAHCCFINAESKAMVPTNTGTSSY